MKDPSLSIPILKVKKLSMRVRFADTEKHDLVQSIKQNFVMQDSTIHGFDDDSEQKLASIMTRNKGLAEWTKNPSTVPVNLWPEALKVSEESGQNNFFLALRSVVQSDGWNSLQGRRRRKRPRLYGHSR